MITRFKQRFVPMYHGFLNKITTLIRGNPIVISDASDNALRGLRIFGKSTQDGTPTPDAPVEIVSVENPTVTLCGKNLLTYPYNTTTKTTGGITFTDNGDGSITVRGTATENVYFILTNTLDLGTTVMNAINAEYSTDGRYVVSKRIYYNAASKVTSINIDTGVTVNETLYPQIEVGTIPTDYEPPKASQSFKVIHQLLGIPVTSGGNYTDANGQQWICDEVDFERGVYVQRVVKLESYNGESISTPYISTTGALTVGATVLYQLSTQIETPLTADQIEAYKSLQTNEPNTTISNDQNAWMEVKYISK